MTPFNQDTTIPRYLTGTVFHAIRRVYEAAQSNDDTAITGSGRGLGDRGDG